MSIEYTYQIVSVDQTARCMEVVYSSEGRQTMHVGVRLPYQGENLQDVIASFAPTGYWADQEAGVVIPEIGTGGSISVPTAAVTTNFAPESEQEDQVTITISPVQL